MLQNTNKIQYSTNYRIENKQFNFKLKKIFAININ
jgi:hypothetical protein